MVINVPYKSMRMERISAELVDNEINGDLK